MNLPSKEAVVKGLLEAGRLLVFSVPAILIQVISGDPALSSGIGVPILIGLKALDRAVHEGKNPFKGILPF